ncbi:MAG: hypothetical protein GX295_08905 [Syntrophomonadaceae bacterium]|nr:hypothetical protein [Syntrophomonadaceae bacterium]
MVFGFLVLVLIFVIVGVLGVKKGYTEYPERGNEMIKTVFVYLVLFATLMMIIGGSVAAFMAVADIVSPPAYYQSFEQYKNIPPEKLEPNLSESELKSRYDQMVTEEKERVKQRAVNSLIKSFGWIIIPLPVFLYFQRRVKNYPVQ